MEFRSQDIAQLVLGYLKESKCKRAFSEFLNNSVYLREHATNYRRGQYFITRVAGLSLVDYLNEYALIYTIVHERLEASEYFKESRSRSSLVKQLLYLLDKLEIQSRTSTPICRENITNGDFFQEGIISNSNNIDSEVEYVPDNVSFDRIPNCLNSTPNNHILRTSTRESSFLNKSKSKVTPKADKSTSTEEETDGKENSHEKCEEIFTNTFLENVELIEKLAHNINKEVSSKSNTELDSMAIESIVQRTQSDPIFVQLLNELIETPDENTKNLEGDLLDLHKSTSSDRPKEMLSSKKSLSVSNETNIKRRLRSSKPQSTNQLGDDTIDAQNDDVVELICKHAASLTNDELPTSLPVKNSTVMSTELVLSTEPSLNLSQSLYTTPSNQNTMFTNTGSLLMLQPSASISTPILPQKTLTIDTTKSCYLIGNQPFVNVSVPPPTPLKIPTVLSEQDILSMPTIFVCDTSQQLANTQTMVVPTSVPCFQNIAPKPTPEKVQSLSEYITLYKCSDTLSSPSISSPARTTAVQAKQTYSNRKPLHINTEDTCIPVESETSQNEKKIENVAKTNTTDTESVTVPSTSPSDLKSETPQIKVAEKKEKLSRATPKGSSHIRQLDFTTPDKWVLPLSTEASTKTKKVANTKSIRTSLFKSPNEEKTANDETTNEELKKKSGSKTTNESSEVPKSKTLEPSWDAALRVFQVEKSPIRTAKQKPSKRKRVEDSTKPISSSKKLKESSSRTDEQLVNKSQAKTQKNDNENSQNLSSNVVGSHKKTKTVEKRLDKTTTKKKLDLDKKTKKKSESVTDDDSVTSKTTNANDEKTDTAKNDINVVAKTFPMIYRNMNSKVRKKCNMDNSKRIVPINEVVLTSVPKIRSMEVLDDNKSTLILSPSKLNANKRTLVDIENHTVIEQSVIKTLIDFKNSTSSENKKESIPEEFVDTSPRNNSLPLLQTPVKIDVLQIPKTPGIDTSIAIDTPFTKAVIDQLSGVDINSIPTPKFPITPNFALTPALTHSPFSNRGTDYSTSSSYYQPSDTEQNKSLEQLIQECQRLEKQDIFSTTPGSNKKVSVESEKIDETQNSTTSLETVLHVADNKGNEMKEKTETVLNKSEESINKILAEKQKAFNESLSGKKNMQLVKMLSDEAGSNSDSVSSNDISSSSDDDSSSTDCSCTVTPLKINKPNPYSLRPRKTSTDNVVKDEKAFSKKRGSHSPVPIIRNEKPLTTHKADVLQKMETIRQRTIAKMKNNPNAVETQKSGTLTKNLTKLRKETSKMSNEKFSNVQKPTNSEATNSTEKKVNENKPTTNSKKTDDSADLITKSKSSGKKINKPAAILNIKEKIKAEHKIIHKITATPVVLAHLKNSKHTKGIPDNKSSSVNKTIGAPSVLTNKEVVTPFEEEEDIVLHLSSDDENLEPFEMVETELLEGSTPSTPLSDNDKMDQDLNNDNKKEESNEKNLDRDAETLVKGLKQWGIHLIPNKSAKNKSATDVKETKDTKPDENKTLMNKKAITIEDKNNLINCETKEIECAVEEIKKMSTPLNNQKHSLESESRATSSQTLKKNSIRSTSEKKATNPKKPKTSAPNKSQSESKHKPKPPDISKSNKPSTDVKDKKVAKISERKSSIEEIKRRLSTTEKEKHIDKEIDLEVQFDTKTFEEETINIKHDYNVPSARKISDYNFYILSKTFSANVFIEEINSDVEKLLSFSSFKVLLDIPSKSLHKKVEKVKTTNENVNSLAKKKKPLEILYNQLIKEPVDIRVASPLQNLYSSGGSRERSTLRRSILTSSSKHEKSEKNNRHNRSLSTEKSESSKEGQSMPENSINNDTKSLKEDEVQGSQQQDFIESNLEVDKDVENVNQDMADSENDLMNYALIGSERIENNDDVMTPSPDKRKRKPSDDVLVENQEEKKKKTEECQELLRNIDVDSFLKHLHGDM